MILYEKYVNYSVFDGEITLTQNATRHILSTIFSSDTSNRNIILTIDGIRYNARLMKVSSSASVQIAYGEDVKRVLKDIFQYSYNYWTNIRAEAKKLNQSTRTLPNQTVEIISIHETDETLVYQIKHKSYFSTQNPFDKDNLEIEESITFPEGKKSYTTHVKYERNQALVNLAKERFKTNHNGSLYCEVCGFSFDKYGERGIGFIEAHHDIPVSELGDNGVSDINDIRMVCSNCHRMLHLKRPWLKVDELKQIIAPAN